MASFHLTIVTPVGTRFDGEAEALVAPGEEGSLGILAHHAPMIVGLEPGVLSVNDGSTISWFAMGPGVLEVTIDNVVTVLADTATAADSEQAAKESVATEYKGAD